MANAYSSLHSLTLAVCVISAIGVSLWGRFAMFRLRKLNDRPDDAAKLITNIGFAFRCLAYVPLLGVLVFVPPFVCSGANCRPGDFANTGLTLSLILGLLAAGVWVWFVFGRIYTTGASKVFADLSTHDRTWLTAAVALAVAAWLTMVVSFPS